MLVGFGLSPIDAPRAWADGPAGSKASDGSAKQIDVLMRLVGRWRIEEDYPPLEGQTGGAKGKGDAAFKKELDGKYVIGEYHSRSKELRTDVKGHAVFTYNPDGGSDPYEYWWFDNYGNTLHFSGRYSSRGDSLVFTREQTDPGTNTTIIDRRTFTFKTDGDVVFTWEEGTGKRKFELILTTTYTPRGKKSDDTKSKPPPRPVTRGM